MRYSREHEANKDLNDDNWDLIKISNVDDKIIKNLLEYITSDVNDNFFISFESLLKIGKKARTLVEQSYKKHARKKDVRREILKFILNYYKGRIKYPLVPRLYHPDFIIRARTLEQIEKNREFNYLKFILPLINDTDDSVRWAAIRVLESFKHAENRHFLYQMLKHRIQKEPNPIIKEKLIKIFAPTK
ncbi:MAG: HEAT repeat domain-containing protein [Promethearchaeota archaeon]